MNETKTPSRARRYTLIGVAVILAVVVIGFLWMVVLAPHAMDFAGGSRVALTEYHGADPTGVPPELKAASLIERGEYLARAADCAACHTAEGGAPYAGGRAFVLPFGTLYSTNITPDKDTGIGNYSDANFLDAVHKGIGRGNTRLYPAMPFASYSYMSDADAGAIKAYLFSLKPVHAAGAAQHAELSVQSARIDGRVGHAVQSGQAIRAAPRTGSAMESRRLSGGGHGPLRRMPHAAQFDAGAQP